MNVYVESNFVLELALLQEQSRSCEEILGLAEDERIQLVVPAYSLIEPYETLIRREKDRQRIWSELNNQIGQIARNKQLKTELHDFENTTALLVRAVEEDKKRLKSVRSRLLQSACVLPMETSVLRDATKYEQELKLSPQDAHIYSAVLGYLKQSEDCVSCFLNKDKKDFDVPEIEEELENYGCKLLSSFDDGVLYVKNQLSR